jgi:hypothetical protein
MASVFKTEITILTLFDIKINLEKNLKTDSKKMEIENHL